MYIITAISNNYFVLQVFIFILIIDQTFTCVLRVFNSHGSRVTIHEILVMDQKKTSHQFYSPSIRSLKTVRNLNQQDKLGQC